MQVGDEQRGYLLELLLTKLRYSTAGVDEVAGEGLQIIGMSATMSNASAFATWLDAELYETTFRPVPLRKFAKVWPFFATWSDHKRFPNVPMCLKAVAQSDT